MYDKQQKPLENREESHIRFSFHLQTRSNYEKNKQYNTQIPFVWQERRNPTRKTEGAFRVPELADQIDQFESGIQHFKGPGSTKSSKWHILLSC